MPAERWLLTVELPPGRRAARFVRWLLKLLRHEGIACRWIGETAELRRLRQLVEGLAARVAAQAELLERRAERSA